VGFDPYAPYGPVVESAVRVVTWNVWGRYGTDHEARQAGLEDVLAEVEPDVICLIEAWRHGTSNQPELIAARLGLPYHRFAGPRMVFYDSWEMAGDGSPGYTWSNRNPLAAIGLYPDRRFDYIFSAWPRRGGVGHPINCAVLGIRPPEQDQISDHYGLLADLRY
jgi:endonuclease/exonuclease/phosphatase family metal-dependent hydrolase